MLVTAISVKERLENLFLNSLYSKKIIEFSNSISFYPIIDVAVTGQYVQYCSMSNDYKKILGYFEAFVDKERRIVENFSLIHFYDSLTFTGVEDLYSFMEFLLIDLDFRKIKFFCLGEKNLKLFKKFAKFAGGRYVGLLEEEEYSLSDNSYVDKHLFEIVK